VVSACIGAQLILSAMVLANELIFLADSPSRVCRRSCVHRHLLG
jgi:hypothetical protein